MCGITVADRQCWAFVVQACMSLITVLACIVLIAIESKEATYAKNLLLVVVSIWLPAPRVAPSVPRIIQKTLEQKHGRETKEGERLCAEGQAQKDLPWLE